MQMTTTTQTLAQFACALKQQPLSPEVIHHAKRAVIDWHAALLPGAVVAPSTFLEQALTEDLDRGQASLALGRAATTRTAALINAPQHIQLKSTTITVTPFTIQALRLLPRLGLWVRK
jgi:2-methylcitrate dehydratase PrpD